LCGLAARAWALNAKIDWLSIRNGYLERRDKNYLNAGSGNRMAKTMASILFSLLKAFHAAKIVVRFFSARTMQAFLHRPD
jgi:hypothetical protein